jgi:predicted metalloprotease
MTYHTKDKNPYSFAEDSTVQMDSGSGFYTVLNDPEFISRCREDITTSTFTLEQQALMIEQEIDKANISYFYLHKLFKEQERVLFAKPEYAIARQKVLLAMCAESDADSVQSGNV